MEVTATVQVESHVKGPEAFSWARNGSLHTYIILYIVHFLTALDL